MAELELPPVEIVAGDLVFYDRQWRLVEAKRARDEFREPGGRWLPLDQERYRVRRKVGIANELFNELMAVSRQPEEMTLAELAQFVRDFRGLNVVLCTGGELPAAWRRPDDTDLLRADNEKYKAEIDRLKLDLKNWRSVAGDRANQIVSRNKEIDRKDRRVSRLEADLRQTQDALAAANLKAMEAENALEARSHPAYPQFRADVEQALAELNDGLDTCIAARRLIDEAFTKLREAE